MLNERQGHNIPRTSYPTWRPDGVARDARQLVSDRRAVG